MTSLTELAETVLTSTSLDAKLATPRELPPDVDRGEPRPELRPARPAGLEIVSANEAPVPGPDGMTDPDQRPRILHALANHELQATELFAWALCAFPGAPDAFRAGLAKILTDEQRHTRMYVSRLRAHGVDLGTFPVSGYFWNKVDGFTSPAAFICAMSLTFENANLDHTVDLAELARRAGDEATAAVIDKVHEDEIEHVRFGWTWLNVFKDEDADAWDVYASHLTWPLRPAKAVGRRFHRAGREAAGLSAEFIARLESSGS